MSISALQSVLDDIGPATIAVSGGVDSMTLAAVACERHAASIVCHAVSPAVPERATRRVKEFAQSRGWNLAILDAGEFADSDYRSNPVNRCFFCKTRLYGSIAGRSDLPVLSGTNLDDLQDFRPGLEAARMHAVRHPFVDADMRKSDVRAVARQLRLAEISDLPASPCLSSRVTTGLPIEADDLKVIERIEDAARAVLGEVTLRCRLTPNGLQLAVDEAVLASLSTATAEELSDRVSRLLRPQDQYVGLWRYQKGSAFVGAPA